MSGAIGVAAKKLQLEWHIHASSSRIAQTHQRHSPLNRRCELSQPQPQHQYCGDQRQEVNEKKNKGRVLHARGVMRRERAPPSIVNITWNSYSCRHTTLKRPLPDTLIPEKMVGSVTPARRQFPWPRKQRIKASSIGVRNTHKRISSLIMGFIQSLPIE